MLPRISVSVLASLLVAPLLTACSGSGGLDASWSVEDALAELPAVSGEDLLVVRAADLEEASDLAGSDPDDDDWLRSLIEDPLLVPVPPSVEQRVDTGVDLADVASFAALQAGSAGVEAYRLREGDPPSASDDAGGLVRSSEDDVAVLASDDDWLDRWRDRDDTLADDEHLGPLADSLDDRDVYAAVLFAATADGPVRAYGVGQAVDDGQAVEYAVFSLADGEDTGDRAEEIEEAWRTTGAVEDGRLAVGDVDIDGDVVRVELRADRAGETVQALVTTLDFTFPS